MKKMKVTKTLYTNKITYAVVGVDPNTKEAHMEQNVLTVYSNNPIIREVDAQKILRSTNAKAVLIDVESRAQTYAMDAARFVELAEVVSHE